MPERLGPALTVARKATNERYDQIPALAHVLLTASEDEGGRLTLTGTDLRWTAAATLSGKVERAGKATISPKGLADFLAACPNGEPLTIDVSDTHRATLTCGRAQARLVGLDPEEFSPAPNLSGADTVSLPSKTLRSLIEQTVFAAATDESRPVLAGLLFRVKDGTLAVVAADGHRLAIASAAVDVDTTALSAIIPARSLAAIVGGLARDDEPVSLSVDDAHARIWAGATTWVVTLIDGQFPDFNRIIPKETKTTITSRHADLTRAIGLARAFEEELTDDRGKKYRTSMVRLSLVGDTLTIRSRSDHGDEEGVSEITVVPTGDDLHIAFNGAYLRDAIEAIDGDEVTLEMVGPASPSLVRAGGERNGHLHVLMPMHVARP